MGLKSPRSFTETNGVTPDSSAQEHRSPRSRFLSVALLLAVALAAFSAVCRQSFVAWDDDLHLYENPYMNPVTPAHVAAFWRAPLNGHYIPISYTLYALLAGVAPFPRPVLTPGGGFSTLNPHVFHTANLVLHLLNVWLVFVILRRIVKHDWAACGGALLFAIHPVQVESVAWVSELRGLLSNLFGLLALWQYLCYGQASQQASLTARVRRHYALALTAFALALLSKPSAVTLPLMAFVLDWGVVRRPWRQAATALLGWALLALPIVWLTRGAQPVSANLLLPLWQRPFVAGDALAFYLSKLLVPTRLAIDYGRTPGVVLHHWGAGLTWLVPCAVGGLAWRRRASAPLLLPALGLFVAALLPVLGFVPFLFQKFSTVADRYLYLALLGPALVLAGALAHWKDRALPISYAAVAAVWLGLTVAQVRVWDDSRTLFEHALAVNPRSAMIQYDLANALQLDGQNAAAIAHYQESLRLAPGFASAHCNIAQALADAGRREDAIAQLREALRLKPDLAIAHLSLGLQLADAGQTQAAIGEWRTTLRLWPENVAARFNLGCALAQRGQPADAAAQFRELLRRAPSFAPAQAALRQSEAQAAASARRGYSPPEVPPGNHSVAAALPARPLRPPD